MVVDGMEVFIVVKAMVEVEVMNTVDQELFLWKL